MAKLQPHALEAKYGLTSFELLDAVHARFRLRVGLEGAVAEVQMTKHIAECVGHGIVRYETHDVDGHPDFSIWLPDGRLLLAECKNIRESGKEGGEAYRAGGTIIGYKVETQRHVPRPPTRRAVSTALTNSRFSECVSARRLETGPTSCSRERSICAATKIIHKNWRCFSACHCQMQARSIRGMLLCQN